MLQQLKYTIQSFEDHSLGRSIIVDNLEINIHCFGITRIIFCLTSNSGLRFD